MRNCLSDSFKYILSQSNRDELIEAQPIPSIAQASREMIVQKMEQIVFSGG
ncbi:MAG: hypothetical protein AAF363_07690 [Bacteroidota bacterium]